jgi:hypothetical protein
MVEDRRRNSVRGVAYGGEQRRESAALGAGHGMSVVLGVVWGTGQMAVGVRLRTELREQDDKCQCDRPARAPLDSK